MSKSPLEKEEKRNRREENFKRRNKGKDNQIKKINKDYKRKKQRQKEEDQLYY